uniref:Polyadenylate-binding protein 2, related n=1 Tax=Neospora caninum (strain Liverpool) TaxID=572307 RepID=A0A0F7U6A4_NEOCL|nr:TPA: Polyadenylate-binding protein 2, related [Neospora caninum Liverpool]
MEMHASGPTPSQLPDGERLPSAGYPNGGVEERKEDVTSSAFSFPAQKTAPANPVSGREGRDSGAVEPGARAEGMRALEEQVQNLDSDWDELQKLQYMTEEAAYSLVQSGASPHSAGAAGPTDGASPGGSQNVAGFANTDTDEVDRRSVYVGNVDYSSTPAELQEHFKSCGTINRITIMVDKYTGHPKGYAYIEFNSEAAVQNAILLSDTVFKQRQIKVVAKRKNIPGFARGRGWRGGRMAAAGGMMGRGRRKRRIPPDLPAPWRLCKRLRSPLLEKLPSTA